MKKAYQIQGWGGEGVRIKKVVVIAENQADALTLFVAENPQPYEHIQIEYLCDKNQILES